MTHYAVIVLTENGYESEVDEMLAPYDENLKVAAYKVPCKCGEQRLREMADVERSKIGLSWEQVRKDFYESSLAPTDENWKNFTRPVREFDEDFFSKHRELLEPVPDCELCGGTGLRTSTHNPNSKWDWYEIGGRWGGVIEDCPAGDLLNRNGRVYVPFAVLAPDGWHEKGRMGWWASVSDEKEDAEWEEEVAELYRKYRNHIAVLVDCHI